MIEKTFNTGRVVGWSSYEEFLKETGTDPSVITPFIYQTLVTYGVTRLIELPAVGWVQSAGGKFYTQTIRVPGASWGAVPIIGLDYDAYMTLFEDPADSTEAKDGLDEQDKNAIEDAIGNVFTVYVSDENGRAVTNAVMDHGYLTFVAYPDILNFEHNVQNIDGSKLKLIVRGLSMEDLDVDELYYGPQGFVFAGNGLAESCYHRTENINNLMIQASSYLMLRVDGSAITAGGGYAQYSDMDIDLEGVVSGYVDINRLGDESYLLDSTEIAAFITDAQTAGVAVTTTAYDKIAVSDKDKYYYLVYGARQYTAPPEAASPMYILCINKDNGYTGLGVMLNIGSRAKVGYDSSDESNPPTKTLNLMGTFGNDSNRILYLKDKNMPDYIGSYWSQSNGWNGDVSYIHSNGIIDIDWNTLRFTYGATFVDAGRNSYIVCNPPGPTSPILMGRTVRVIGEVGPSEDAAAIHGMYVCTLSKDNDSQYSKIVLNRRGGYLNTTAQSTSDPRVGTDYTRLPDWPMSLRTPASGEHFLVDDSISDYACRIYRNEMVWINKPGGSGHKGYGGEWIVANIETSGAADLIVYRAPTYPLLDAASDVANYAGSSVDTAYTNAISVTNFSFLFPTNITVYANPYASATSASYTLSHTGTNDTITLGTLFTLKHTVANVYGTGESRWYQYGGEESSAVLLISSTSQKDGTNFYTLSGMTSHLDSGFPRSKQDIPDAGGSYYYDYPRAVSRITVDQFFNDFGLDITEYLHPDFRGTSMLKFLQNLVVYQHLGKPMSASNKRSVGFSTEYHLFTTSALASVVSTPPTEQNPVNATITLSAHTDPTSFSSPGFFTAQYINPDGSTFNIANPDYPIWGTVAKSKSGPQIMSASLYDGDGSRLDGSGSAGVIEADTVKPNDILVGLALGKSVDLLRGMKVRRLSTGGTCLIAEDGTRLYLSSTEPVSTVDEPIPEGSYGLGF